MSRARDVASELEDDGDARATGERVRHMGFRSLLEYLESQGARCSRHTSDQDVMSWSDGSAIVVISGAWDVRPEGCDEGCWEGVGCDCAQRAHNHWVGVGYDTAREDEYRGKAGAHQPSHVEGAGADAVESFWTGVASYGEHMLPTEDES